MYTTIEADIENGIVCSADASRLPAHAHVLITLFSFLPDEVRDGSFKTTAHSTPLRKPHADIRGRVNVLGDIMNTAATEAWN